MSKKLKPIVGNMVKFATEMKNSIEMLKIEIKAVKINNVFV